MPDSIDTSCTIYEFDIHEIITNYELDGNCTYQQYFARNKMYQAYLSLTHNSKSGLFLKDVIKLENKEKFNAVCKHIVMFLYIAICGISNEKYKDEVFELVMMNEMKKEDGSKLDGFMIRT